ncbi:endoglucanase [Curtobacterium sp. PhB130]|uniref:glycosyl hydrolase family 8 n=1 Tax=Curtobacterium sp. PhB130 TaxID=2485178 RepID=UPI000F4C54BE|nr:glycosyl hydrolase family 8 [Curtobacterium sp. PhB130]ROS74842.1 endoglucanase [Curtobacterium sp. PhB130]
MTRRNWIPVTAVGLAAVLVAGGIAVAAVRPWSDPASDAGGASTPTSTTAPDGTRSAAELRAAFLDRYEQDGRIVRTDQGDDTVSEGQAYGLLIAYASGDRERFGDIWKWTAKHMLTDDDLLAWRWTTDGGIADGQSASDADLDTARALVLAGSSWGNDTYTKAGKRMAAAVLEHETATTDLGRILLPGPWADSEPYRYDASYASPAAYRVLASATGDDRWKGLEAGSRAVTKAVLEKSDLPSDWSQVHADGSVDPMPATGNDARVLYGYDAMRMPLRYAEACTSADRSLAASIAPTLRRTTQLAAQLDLGGTAVTGDRSALAYVARAAAEQAAGSTAAAAKDVDRADRTAATTPTYYGDAWAALGATMLTSDVLGGCATSAGGAS